MNNGPLLIYLTARDKSRGEAALTAIRSDSQLHSAKALAKDGGVTDIEYLPLDISSAESIGTFEQELKTRHPEGIDLLVNNAGVAIDGFSAETVRETLACNYYGTLNICESMLPHMKQDGRIVNVSSMVGKLGSKYSSSLTQAFREAQTTKQVSGLMQAFQDGVASGKHTDEGWPTSAYAVSKTGVTAMTKVLGQLALSQGRGVTVNSCCPGYVDTDMTKHKGRKTPDQGANTPVHVALADIKGVSGEFWEFEEVSSW